jgi:hypothetical protein
LRAKRTYFLARFAGGLALARGAAFAAEAAARGLAFADFSAFAGALSLAACFFDSDFFSASTNETTLSP